MIFGNLLNCKVLRFSGCRRKILRRGKECIYLRPTWKRQLLLDILDMSGFDIIWLLVCIGLPVVSGILSAGKKQKAKTKAGEPVGKRDFLEDLVKEVTKELKEYNSSGDKSIDDEEKDSGKTPASPATDGGLSPAASSRKAAAYAESRRSGERYGGMETRHGTAAEPSVARPSVTYGKRVPSMRPATAGGLTAEAAKTTRTTCATKYESATKYASATRTAKTAQSADPMAAKHIRPASSYHKHQTLENKHITPEHLRGESGSTATEPVLQMADSKAGVERIDPRRMIIYDAVLNPKFRE